MPRLAIVISAVGTIESLEGTLVSVLENRPADCEILVALNQPYQDPYSLQGEVRFLDPPRRSSPIQRIQQALAGTRAPLVHLLASGCEVSEGWADEALARFGDRRVASVAPLVSEPDGQRIVAVGVGYRHRGQRFLVGQGRAAFSSDLHASTVGPASFAAFYRKSAIDFVGGMSTQLGLRQADVDLALTLRHAGFTTAVEPRSRVSAAQSVDPCQSPRLEALYNERLFWRQLPVGNWLGAVAGHTSLVAVETLASIGRPRMVTQIAARAWACCQRGSYARRRRALLELSKRAVSARQSHDNLRVDRAHQVPAPSETTSLGASVR